MAGRNTGHFSFRQTVFYRYNNHVINFGDYMLNIKRTKEVFGYEVSLERIRRSNADIGATAGVQPKNLTVIDNCPLCKTERSIKLNQSRKNKPCSKCFHSFPETIQAKQNQKKEKSEETKQKMRENHWSKKGYESAFKGKTHTQKTKEILSDKTKDLLDNMPSEDKTNRYIKGSCTLRGIDIESFDGWITDENLRIRGSAEYKKWEEDVFERDKRCQFYGCLERRTSQLVAHHKDGFSWCKERRFDVSNGIILCKFHHTTSPISFHRTYSNHGVTEAQFVEWMAKYTMPSQKNKTIYVVTGAPGSGKSWVCDNLANQYSYISYDDFPKESHLQLIFSDNSNKPILYDPWRKATSFVKRYSGSLDIKLVVIVESLDVVKERILSRGGTVNENTEKYVKRAVNIACGAHFSGTSYEVLEYLKQSANSHIP